MKDIIWNEKARKYVRSLDINVRKEVGSLLMLIQSGRTVTAPQSKPIKVIHKNAHELRIIDKRGAYRVIYVLNVKDKIFIPHAFTKKTQKTSQNDINVSIKRIQEHLNENI
jgi:phage-related protein